MRAGTATAAVLLLALLTGCSSQSPPPSAPTQSATPTPTATAPVEPVDEFFTMPTACLDILPAERLAALDADGLVLLGGPDGEYGDDYLLDPSPEQEAGGITCIWGPPDTEVSSVAISVAPLSATSRPAIVSDLSVSQGLNETSGDSATYYWQLGDTDQQPAILNVLTADSWISVIMTIGGTDNYATAERLAAEVHERVHE